MITRGHFVNLSKATMPYYFSEVRPTGESCLPSFNYAHNLAGFNWLWTDHFNNTVCIPDKCG